ncbi:MAG: RagB/SusD family nutrient uptake outer membrane protein [Prevotella sp.]|nr:RagB/SusD family nutrient uptake outer membrane protein [Prevotella sp.]
MKKNNIIKFMTLCFGAVALASCDEYLDELPDDRAELDTELKITQLLVSAYPSCTNSLVAEFMSDNVDDNGRGYSAPVILEDLYKFKDTSEEGNDTPYFIWNGYYASVATVNQALEAAEALGNPVSLRGSIAEAKLIRAYSMFNLAYIFCMAYDEATADTYMGLPYPLVPEQDINTHYERGTLRQLYEAIDKDIEEALPYIREAEAGYAIPKYHFTARAAYAFAARFNLFYNRWEKAVEYANEALGSDPTAFMRDYEPYRELGSQDFFNLWIRSSDQANLMMIAAYSISPRYQSSTYRYAHNYTMTAYETYWVDGPWGSGSDENSIIYANKMYGSNQIIMFPSYFESFEYTDKVAGIGYTHSVYPAFTGDLTLLDRAEALILLKRYDEAMRDINTWIGTHCKDKYETDDDTNTQVLKRAAPGTLTVADIDTFMVHLDYAKRTPEGRLDRSMRKHMHPQGFTIDSEGSDQECLLQFLLHMRRIESVRYGYRFGDVKRYGIEYAHLNSYEDPNVFIAGDLRGAVQIPQTVITAGLPGNPRMDEAELKAYLERTEAEYATPEDEDEDNGE